jgi:hypothetical protein
MIASLCIAALLPGTAAWEPPADLVRGQYAELRAWFEKQTAPSGFDARAIGAVHRFLSPKPAETRPYSSSGR